MKVRPPHCFRILQNSFCHERMLALIMATLLID